MKNVDPDCIPAQAKHAVNNGLPFPPHLFISFSPVLTLSEHFYVSIYKLLAHPIDLIVSTAVTYLNLGLGLEACAAFYCQNSLTERLNSLKTSETGNPRLDGAFPTLSPWLFQQKFPLKNSPLVEIPWLL